MVVVGTGEQGEVSPEQPRAQIKPVCASSAWIPKPRVAKCFGSKSHSPTEVRRAGTVRKLFA